MKHFDLQTIRYAYLHILKIKIEKILQVFLAFLTRPRHFFFNNDTL